MTSGPPPIAPRPVGADDRRPRWSVMIPVHNCADLLARCLPEVVAQLGGRDDVHIEVIDDMSADDPASVVGDLAGGIATYTRLSERHGAIANFNRCLERSRGELVHLLHGDDAVLPGFYAAMEAAFRDASVVAAVCRTEYVDEDDRPIAATRSERSGTGPWDDALEALAVSNRIRPAGVVVRRRSYEELGGFRTDLPHAADWEMWTRLAAHGTIWFLDEVLARYRTHSGSDTAARIETADNIRERIEAIDKLAPLLPAEKRTRLARRALAYSSAYAAQTSIRQLRRRRFRPAASQARAAIECLGRAALPRPCAGDSSD